MTAEDWLSALIPFLVGYALGYMSGYRFFRSEGRK